MNKDFGRTCFSGRCTSAFGSWTWPRRRPAGLDWDLEVTEPYERTHGPDLQLLPPRAGREASPPPNSFARKEQHPQWPSARARARTVHVDLTSVTGLEESSAIHSLPLPLQTALGRVVLNSLLEAVGLAAGFYVYLVSREQCLLWGVWSAGYMK